MPLPPCLHRARRARHLAHSLAQSLTQAARRLLLALLLGAPLLAWSDTYPSKPIRLIVPFSPGGATDVVARLVAQKLSEGLKQPVVIDNRAGANGIIGTEMAARAAPDGYTLLLNSAGAQTLSPIIYKAGYEPLKSFEPICLIANIGFVMVVHPSVPAKTVQEFVQLARSHSRPLNMSSGSSMVELIGEQFKTTTGTKNIVSVPYKGTGPQLSAVVAGEVDMTIDPFNSLQMIKAGKLRPLAVLSAKRSPALPDVPTMEEAGVPGMVFNSWAGLLAPAGTPKDIVARLHKEMVQVLAQPEVQKQLTQIDYEVAGSTPEQFAAVIREDAARWARIVKASGYKAAP